MKTQLTKRDLIFLAAMIVITLIYGYFLNIWSLEEEKEIQAYEGRAR